MKCPNCQIEIDKSIKEKIEAEFSEKYNKVQKELDEDKKNLNQIISDEVKKASLKKESELRQTIKKDLENEHSQDNKLLEDQLNEKNIKISELNKQAIENRELKEKLENQELNIKANYEIEFSKRREEDKKNIEEQIREENELIIREKDEKLKDVRNQLKITQRKAEQGSMQLQGEVQELAIENFLEMEYPFDIIEEIKKGVRGGDCIQTVNTREIQNCGKIYYESKRTKEFQKSWIEKFKTDMRDKNINLGILITQTLPKNIKKYGLINGVWVCSFLEFKGLSMILRENVINIHKATISQENRSDKMSMLYDYLTSPAFSMSIESLNETSVKMSEDLEKEKRAMNRLWKEREKQIQKLTANFDSMYASIKGIAGNSIQSIKSLELGFEN